MLKCVLCCPLQASARTGATPQTACWSGRRSCNRWQTDNWPVICCCACSSLSSWWLWVNHRLPTLTQSQPDVSLVLSLLYFLHHKMSQRENGWVISDCGERWRATPAGFNAYLVSTRCRVLLAHFPLLCNKYRYWVISVGVPFFNPRFRKLCVKFVRSVSIRLSYSMLLTVWRSIHLSYILVP